MKKSLICLYMLLASLLGFAQDSLTSKAVVINHITKLQSHNNDFYLDGSFHSKRMSRNGKISKEDNNIFFTALIDFTLNSIKTDLKIAQKMRVDSIINRIKPTYKYYQNRDGDITYNFWRTKPDQPMPNSQFWSKLDLFLLADDLDDTSLIYLNLGERPQQDSLLKAKMTHFTNLAANPLKSTFKRYRQYEAYYSWFGENMKQDFDISTLSNILLFTLQNNLPLSAPDFESISLIENILKHKDHLKHPQIVSPWYQNKAIILYHLARLIAVADLPRLNQLKPQLIEDIKAELNLSKIRLEQLMLTTSLYRLGAKVTTEINLRHIEDTFNDFAYFYVNPFAGSHITIKRLVGKLNLAYYTSEAYYWTLILEYLVLSEQK